MKKVIYTNKAPDPVGPYNQAIFSNNTLYISGQVALDPKSGKMINKSLKDETNQVCSRKQGARGEIPPMVAWRSEAREVSFRRDNQTKPYQDSLLEAQHG